MSPRQRVERGRAARPALQWGAPLEEARVAVLAVHGRGQSPEFMRQVSARFGALRARFYAPEAPGGTWYPRPFLEPLERNQPELDRALAAIDAALGGIGDAGFPPHRVALWGFSQGACLLCQYVLACALEAPRRFGGLVLFTGGYPGPEPRPAPEGHPLRGVAAVVRSLDQDPWVPRFRVEETAALLARAGAAVDLRVDPGDEHIITGEACEAATRLLAAMAG